MEKTIGETIKFIRTSKNISQKEICLGVPSANGEFVSIRRFPLISPVILYNKECFQNNSKNQLDNSGN